VNNHDDMQRYTPLWNCNVTCLWYNAFSQIA